MRQKNQLKLQNKTQLHFHANAVFLSYRARLALWNILSGGCMLMILFEAEEKRVEVL